MTKELNGSTYVSLVSTHLLTFLQMWHLMLVLLHFLARLVFNLSFGKCSSSSLFKLSLLTSSGTSEATIPALIPSLLSSLIAAFPLQFFLWLFQCSTIFSADKVAYPHMAVQTCHV